MNAPAQPIMQNDPATSFIDLERYPIADLESPVARTLISTLQSEMAECGACCLKDFILPGALEALRCEAEDLAPHAYGGPTEVTPYFFNYDIGEGMDYPEDHPTKRTSPRRLAQVAGDLIPGDALIRQIHHSQVMMEFIARVLGDSKIYPLADTKQCLNISVMEENGCQQWHFDRGRSVITLLAQAPEGGGCFEYVPNIRSESDENFDAVGRVLDGDRSMVKSVNISAGTLMMFRGHYSLHRVTPVEGTRRRLQLIFAYADTPGQHGSVQSSNLHYRS